MYQISAPAKIRPFQQIQPSQLFWLDMAQLQPAAHIGYLKLKVVMKAVLAF